MAGFTVKTWNGTTGGGAALATESNAIFYRLRQSINQPMTAEVYLNDPNFAATQKYMVTGSGAYMGLGVTGAQPKGQIQIEQPTNTTVFDGVIVGVEPMPRQGLVKLECRDWLHQLEAQRITYDTRVDLDGSGLRESYPFRQSGTDEEAVFLSGAEYRVYDTKATAGTAWTAEQWNSGYYMVFGHQMAGSPTVVKGADSVSLTNCSAGAPGGGDIGNTWVEGEGGYVLYADAPNDDTTAQYTFKTNIDDTKIESVDLMLWIRFWGNCADCTISAYDYGGASYEIVATMDPSNGPILQRHFTDIGGMAEIAQADLVDSQSSIIQFEVDSTAPNQALYGIYYMTLTYNMSGVTGNSTAYDIDDTGTDYIAVSENLVTANIDVHCPYSVTQSIYTYVKDLVDDYDTVKAIDTTTDGTDDTDEVCARHFHYMKPIDILRHLAAADGTTFWLDVGTDLHWNDPYTTGATTVTDSDILYWVDPELTIKDFADKIQVLGMRYGTGQVSYNTSDATAITNYGTYTLVEENPTIYHLQDATTLGTRLLARHKDPKILVRYAVNGFSTLVVGEKVTINSADLGISSVDYVVVDHDYRSRTGVTTVTLTPKQTILQAPILFNDTVHQIRDQISHATRHTSYAPRHTETW